jgi:uncharacterized Tic20 family protein
MMPNDHPYSFRERSLAALCHLSTLSWPMVFIFNAIVWVSHSLYGLAGAPAQSILNLILASLALPLVIPIIIWISIGNTYLFTKQAVVEVFNVYLSFLCYLSIIVIIAVLVDKISLSLIDGYALSMAAIGSLSFFSPGMLIATMTAVIKACTGQEFRYPLVIRFITNR